MDKEKAVEKLISRLEKDLAELEAFATSAIEAIADAPGPMQSHSDTTRFTKTQQLQSATQSIREKQRALQSLKEIATGPAQSNRITTGSLVQISSPSKSEYYLIVPFVPGIRVEVDDVHVLAITPQTPLAQALLGAHVGDEVDLAFPTQRRVLIIAVS